MTVSTNIHHQRLALAKPYMGRLALGFMIMVITVVIQLSFPQAVAYFIDNSVTEKSTEWLTIAGLVMVLIFMLQAVATSMRYYLFESTGTLIITALRQRLFGAIIRQDIGFFDHANVGDLTNRLSADVELLQDTLTMGLALALRALFTFIGGTILLLMLSPTLALLLLVVVPLSMWSARWAGKMIGGRAKAMQDNLARCTQVAQESFSNIRLVHGFTKESQTQQKYAQATTKAMGYSLATTRTFAIFQGLGTFIQYMALLVTLWFGGQLVASGSMTIGGLTSFIMYAAMVATSASGVSWFWGEWMKSIGATERVFELLNRTPQTRTASATATDQQTTPFKGEISFDNINFSYPTRADKPALKHFNLTIKAGETIALVGPSGAGKSTVANLILGFYQANNGHLRFDGIDAQQLDLTTIRQNVAIVEQEPALFSGTIMDNIRYAVSSGEVSDQAVIEAAKHANADAFICEFADGYQTQLGERGVQLSGGQKQRIAIARAILRDSKILILDEATSALDSHSEQQVQTALDRLMQDRTTIMIAHRFSTIAKAQRIVVLENGRISQNGSHDALIQQTDGLYLKLMNNQMEQPESVECLV
ncbi:MAG: ATP-binding cassette subfamily B protein [Phenylobacterium sp.]|jgi:ATP-binding cassette subfamily B protein